jgi:hypothetical protein
LSLRRVPRIQLAAAIKNAAEAKAKLAAHRAAIKRADEQVTASERRLEERQAETAQAKSAYAGQLAQAVAAGASTIPGTPKGLRDAELKEADAANTLDAVRVAATRLKGDLRGVEIDVPVADLVIIAEINKLARPEIEAEIERGETALTQAISSCVFLSFLSAPDADERVYVNESGLPFSETQRISAARLKAGQRIPPELQERVRALFTLARRVFCFAGDFHTNAYLPKDARARVDACREDRRRLRSDASADVALPGEEA